MNLLEHFGNIDIYLFDQILRGRIAPGMRIVDAGCGYGRNVVYFLNEGYEVYGVDRDADAIASLPANGNFHVASIEAMPFPDAFADVVIAHSVLHFASNDAHFQAMLAGLWRVLKPGGMLFTRLASTIGMEHRMRHIEGRRYLLPDGSERYLVDEALLMALTKGLGGKLLDPIKTTIVQDARCMTTWVVGKT
jgi:SAM-dependent methyltransferase